MPSPEATNLLRNIADMEARLARLGVDLADRHEELERKTEETYAWLHDGDQELTDRLAEHVRLSRKNPVLYRLHLEDAIRPVSFQLRHFLRFVPSKPRPLCTVYWSVECLSPEAREECARAVNAALARALMTSVLGADAPTMYTWKRWKAASVAASAPTDELIGLCWPVVPHESFVHSVSAFSGKWFRYSERWEVPRVADHPALAPSPRPPRAEPDSTCFEVNRALLERPAHNTQMVFGSEHWGCDRFRELLVDALVQRFDPASMLADIPIRPRAG